SRPRLVARMLDAGYVYDVSVSGNTAYLALGTRGLVMVDVTDPARPLLREGMEAFGDASLETVVAGAYAGYAGGVGVVQVTPDVILKIHRIDPGNGILDLDANGRLEVRLRFNKAI